MNNSTKKRLIAEGKLRIEAPRPHLVKRVRRKLAKTFGLHISSDVDPRWNRPRYKNLNGGLEVEQQRDYDAEVRQPEVPTAATPETPSKQP